jgi:hypothetical protein
MINMKTQFTGIALAAMLTIGWSLPGYAEDAAKPTDDTAPAAAAPKAEAPASVPRPSIAPKAAEPAVAPNSAEQASPPAAEPVPRRHRRHARHHYRRYAYWEPFPIYFPHFHRHRIYWNRIPWFFF